MNVAAVIVTYNPQISDVTILINNISESVFEIIVVDNGSENIAAIRNLKSLTNKLIINELGENKGIGFAQNNGILKAFENTAIEAIVLFDHDSHPEKEMINILASEYSKMVTNGINVGAVGPVFYDPRTNDQYPISEFSGFRLIKKYPVKGNNQPIEASLLIASGSLIPRKSFEIVGGMNEEFFIDYIDIEWGFRAQSKGYKLFACPPAKMAHQVGDRRIKIMGREISVHSPLRRYYLARNSVFMIKTKYINWKYKVREVFYSFSRVIIFLLYVDKKTTYLKYILQGWGDGFKNKSGKYSN